MNLNNFNCPNPLPGPNEISLRNSTAILQMTGAKGWQKGVMYGQTLSGGGAKEVSLISLRDRTSCASPCCK